MTDATAVSGAPASPVAPLKLNRATKLFYGFGSIAYGVKDGGFRSFLLLYYNQVVGLEAHLVGLAIMTALVVDSVLDPIIGQVSDNWRSRWGRRHPFMYFAALPAAVFYFILWTPPADWSHQALFFYILVVAVVVRTFITLYEIPSSAMVAELSSDYDERTRLMSYRYFFGVWGGLLLGILTLVVFLQPTEQYPRGQLNPDGYLAYAWTASGLILASIVISALGTHRFIPMLRKASGEKKSVWQSLKDMASTLSNKSFLMLMIGGIFKGTGLGLSSALVFYWGTYLWELSSAQMAILLVDSLFSAVIALALAPRLAKRFGKKPVAIWSLILAVGIGVAPLILRYFGLFFENGSPWLLPVLFVHGVIYAACGIISLILVSSMIADVVEDSETRTGRRSEGLFFAASSLVQKAISGVGVFVSGLVLTAAAFPAGARPGEVEPATMQSLIAIYAPTLIGFYALGIFFMALYSIDRRRHEENLRQLNTQ
ncbi:MAG: MFS transporter [Hyphomonadaceae bacterium]